MRWSEEQSAIINSQDERLVVEARAGTGKTTTMVGYTRAREHMKYGYLVFNKANRQDAMERFPENVTPLTGHGLAYRAVGYRYRGKLGDPKPVDISEAFGVSFQEAGKALELLKRFFNSDEDSLEAVAGASEALPLAQEVWAGMSNPRNRDILMPHDGYLKIFALERRQVPFDGLVFDEAQDVNPVTLGILMRQKKPLVVVGDPFQSIYSFRGAVNALEQFDGARHYLTKSYRFGPEVAAAANAVLRQLGEQKLLEGYGAPSTVQHGAAPSGAYTFLARTNAGVIQKAINSPGKMLHFVGKGGLENYRVERILDVHRLYAHTGGEIRDSEIRKLKSFDRVVAYAEQINDPELKAIIKLVQNEDLALPQRLAELSLRSGPAEEAELVLTTLHRSKGLEWDTVELGECFDWDDFAKARSAGKADEYREELNLLYVGATRARKELNINKTLQAVIREAAAAPSAAAEKVIRVSTATRVEVRQEEDCRFLGDMHGDYDDDGPQPPEAVMEPLRHVLCDRSCFIVEQNGSFGVLVEEIAEDIQTGGARGLAAPVGKLASSHPAAQVWLTSGPHIEAGCTAVRAFIPAEAVNAGRIQGLAVAVAALVGRDSRAKHATADAMSM